MATKKFKELDARVKELGEFSATLIKRKNDWIEEEKIREKLK